MLRRKFLCGAAAVGVLALRPFGALAAQPPQPRRLNLLFITADDLDWSLPGFMSGRRNFTPNLDALAARSFRFVNNRTVAPICQPAREAMMTGLLPHHSGGIGFVPVNAGTPTLATLLQAAGYYAAGIHKVEHMQPATCFPWDYAQESHDRNPEVYHDGVRLAILEARDQNKPFFVNCNMNDPHRPFYGSKGAARADHDQQGPYQIPHELGPDDVTVPPHLDDLPGVRKELSQYYNSVQRLDITLGRILKALEESGEAANTLVIFSSDHGMPFPFSKATCYDHGTRVPVLIGWPGMGTPRAFTDLTTNVDILPTLLDILGVPHPGKVDGVSWLPLMQGGKGPQREFVVTYVNTVVTGMAYPMRAVQNMDYALCFTPWADGTLQLRTESMSGLSFPAMVEAAKTDPRMAARIKQYVEGVPLAFYDLKADPGQRVNLIDDPRHKARIAHMKDALMKDMEATADPQLDNYRALLAGRKPVVPQDPARYRSAAARGEGEG